MCGIEDVSWILEKCYSEQRWRVIMAFPWACPYCGRSTTITDSDVQYFTEHHRVANAMGPHSLQGRFIVCPNSECKKYTFDLWLTKTKIQYGDRKLGDTLNYWRLVPPSNAKIYPDYVPKAIIKDYEEACLILEGSPKASATLSRRCLQSIIRDFWKIKRPENHKGPWRLKEEIEAIKDKVDPLTWKAIDAVRKIGNIGAHMEEDINLIIEVKPVEAEKLIGLIELLLSDWYINRHERETRLSEITALAAEKDDQKNGKDTKSDDSTGE